jgi:hypothetical protein
VIVDCATPVFKLYFDHFRLVEWKPLAVSAVQKIVLQNGLLDRQLSNLLPLLPSWQSHPRPFTGTPVTRLFPSC